MRVGFFCLFDFQTSKRKNMPTILVFLLCYVLWSNFEVFFIMYFLGEMASIFLDFHTFCLAKYRATINNSEEKCVFFL